jgi:flagellar basal-body rod protein FlgG
MNRGIYAAANGMVAQQYAMDAVANNLANLGTTGYKQDVPSFRELHAIAASRYSGSPPQRGPYVGELGTGAALDSAAIDLSRGPLVRTREPLDLAIEGDGFFAIQTPAGIRLTRDGHFHRMLDGSGKVTGLLANDDGDLLMGEKGPIDVGKAARVEIARDGAVSADGRVVGRVRLKTAPREALHKEGGNRFAVDGTPTDANAAIKQEFLEQSNVDPIRSMVKIIAVQRAYEAMQKAIVAQDETLTKAAVEIARV